MGRTAGRPASAHPLGRLGEEAAAEFLRRRGLVILERNLRSRLGELDLIARDGPAVVFVEVKARQEGVGDPPQAAVDARKQARLARLALAYLARERLGEVPCRFDVVAVTFGAAGLPSPAGIPTPRPLRVEYFPSAFGVDGGRR